MRCHLCDSPDVVYVDALGLHWCRKHYHSIYLKEDE